MSALCQKLTSKLFARSWCLTSLHWAAATGNELILVRIPLGRDPPMSALLLFAAPAEPDLKPD
jgi:hypothetical protein